jgi:hypothetical protein
MTALNERWRVPRKPAQRRAPGLIKPAQTLGTLEQAAEDSGLGLGPTRPVYTGGRRCLGVSHSISHVCIARRAQVRLPVSATLRQRSDPAQTNRMPPPDISLPSKPAGSLHPDLALQSGEKWSARLRITAEKTAGPLDWREAGGSAEIRDLRAAGYCWQWRLGATMEWCSEGHAGDGQRCWSLCALPVQRQRRAAAALA